ncbi:hypothetical protein [Sphingomonas sp. CARO-RG-8B-R24-01]|uniref:hypothetical protein n=1 Tax=Sphingomonas sp. CARO-RG-8B-R24-01 TaxID=2914831 RepID=UPI001F568DE2|nr:hypothetical protein [Sphingomonas sp. CARO-RG-8B-R24-01]
MIRLLHTAAAAVTIMALAPLEPASGQTQAQQDRLSRVAQFVVTAPMCERLGMSLDPDLPTKAESALQQETGAWNVDPSTIERLKGEAVTRQGAMLKTDLETVSEGAKTAPQLQALKGVLLGYGRTCMAAVTDPIFSHLILPPPGYDLETAATTASDAMLQAGGLASWQTPRIQAHGDMMMLAGTCRSKIGAARSDALMKEFGHSEDARVRSYYSKSFDEGLADPTIIASVDGCTRAIQQTRLKAR